MQTIFRINNDCTKRTISLYRGYITLPAGAKIHCRKDNRIPPSQQRELDASFQFGYKSQPGSKVIFYYRNYEQIRVDAYLALWKKKVFRALNNALRETTALHLSSKQKKILQNWLFELKTKSSEEIASVLAKEIYNDDSVLNQHDSKIYCFINRTSHYLFSYGPIVKTDIHNIIADLLNTIKIILKCEFTTSEIKTGGILKPKVACHLG